MADYKRYPCCSFNQCGQPVTPAQLYIQFAIGFLLHQPDEHGHDEDGQQWVFHYPECFYRAAPDLPEELLKWVEYMEVNFVEKASIPEATTEQIKEAIKNGTIGELYRTVDAALPDDSGVEQGPIERADP